VRPEKEKKRGDAVLTLRVEPRAGGEQKSTLGRLPPRGPKKGKEKKKVRLFILYERWVGGEGREVEGLFLSRSRQRKTRKKKKELTLRLTEEKNMAMPALQKKGKKKKGGGASPGRKSP